jgi:uncharacterized protein YggE
MKMLPFALVGCCLFAACQPQPVNTIQVTGEATMKVVPNMAELSLRVYNVRPAMKDAVAETQGAVDQVLAVCHKFIPADEDIKVSSVATDKDYDYANGRNVFRGYSAEQILEVRLKDIGKMEAFAEELLGTKITNIQHLRYNHTKADSIQRVVNLLALTDAKKTAEKMCEQMNVAMGKVVSMSNYPTNGGRLGGMRSEGGDYELNLYSKSFGGRGFKMSSQILEFRDVAFAGFAINQ